VTEPLLRAEKLSRSFGAAGGLSIFRHHNEIRAVDEVSLRLLEPTAGRVFFDGTDLTLLPAAAMRRMRRNFQMVFQDPYGSLSPRLTIGNIIAEPLRAHGMAGSPAQLREKVASLLRAVGLLPEHAARYPRQFSGGQRQRIGVARAIAADPLVIVADEPVSALDVSVQAQVINLFQDLQQARGLSYLFIAHDLAVVRHIADRVAVMYLGRIVEIGPKRAIYNAPQHPYTQALLSAAPSPDPDAPRRRIVLEGDVPNPARIPPGCSFHPRCPIATELCRTERPTLRPVAPEQSAACHHAKPMPIPT
jgi:peptide/nickel transport system ATP-binding protein/oligopeptide transport system ATP-binding protein